MTATSGLPAPHPRFRARRIEIRKEAGKRRLHRLVALLATAGVGLGAVAVANSPLLDIDDVAVAGTRRTHPDAIAAALGAARGDALFSVDLARAAANVEALPWVETATVTRDYPGTLRVTVTERRAEAIVAGIGASVLVDDDGRVLDNASATTTSPNLLRVLVAEPVPEPGQTIPPQFAAGLDLAIELRADAGEVLGVQVEDELGVILASGGRALFGDPTALPAKVEALRLVLARVELDCVATVDLRVPTRPVLTRNPSCS